MWEETPPAFYAAPTGIIIEQIIKYSTEFVTDKSNFVLISLNINIFVHLNPFIIINVYSS